jgi:hypothetical protein
MVHYHAEAPKLKVHADGSVSLHWPPPPAAWIKKVAKDAELLLADYETPERTRAALEQKRDMCLAVLGSRASSEILAAVEAGIALRSIG